MRMYLLITLPAMHFLILNEGESQKKNGGRQKKLSSHDQAMLFWLPIEFQTEMRSKLYKATPSMGTKSHAKPGPAKHSNSCIPEWERIAQSETKHTNIWPNVCIFS